MSGANTANNPSGHTWRFFRAGGFNQVNLSSSEDLRSLATLDQKLWVALSCPTRGIEFDEKTLDLVDTDKDGRIRAGEILAAVAWTSSLLKEPADIFRGSRSLPLASIDDTTPEGKAVLASAKEILANLGRRESEAVSLDDTTDTARIFAQTRFNGDGIVPADAADNPDDRQLITDIIACLGAKTDRSGKPGIDRAALDKFVAEAKAYSDWWAQGQKERATILPLGDATAAAASAVAAVRAKVDDYFTRCRLAAFDKRAASPLSRGETEYAAMAGQVLTADAPEIAALPLATTEPGKPLGLSGQLNPAWEAAIGNLAKSAVAGLLGETDELTEADWATLKAKVAPYEAWIAAKAGATVERLGIERVGQILDGPGIAAISSLIVKDMELEPVANSISALDKLVRFHRDLGNLLDNFVSFRDFYSRRNDAVFQAGTLYLDQRSCELCVRVDDMAKHSTLAHLSRMYLAYCDVVRKSTGEKMTIAAGFTNGDSDNLMVGRNGVFYDRRGHDWDATVTKIVENPIGIRQAFFAPYKRVLRWIEEQVAKRAAAADAATTDKLTTAPVAPGKPGEQKPKFDVGVIAALGVAVGGVTAALGALLQAFFGLGIWMPLGIIAMILLISGPSMLIAWLKLRQRNLGPLLDANGWAINARARINIPLGRSLTSIAKVPAAAHLSAADPFAESRRGWRIAIAVAVILAILAGLWFFGAVERVAPGVLPRSSSVTRREEAKKSAGSTDSHLAAQAEAPPSGTAANP